MILAQGLAKDLQRPRVVGPRPGQVARGSQHHPQVVDVPGDVGVVGAEGGFVNGQRPLVVGPRPVQGGVVGGQRGRFLRPHPPHEVVFCGVAIGVLDGQLGFAHPAQAGDGLGEGDVLAGGEGRAEGGQKVSPPGKVGVAAVGEVPDGGANP
jgi:hypothetical protein